MIFSTSLSVRQIYSCAKENWQNLSIYEFMLVQNYKWYIEKFACDKPDSNRINICGNSDHKLIENTNIWKHQQLSEKL